MAEKLGKGFDAFDESLPAIEKEFAKAAQELFQSLIDTIGGELTKAMNPVSC